MIEIAKKEPAATPAGRASDDAGSNLLGMLIAGLIMIVIGYAGIMIFV